LKVVYEPIGKQSTSASQQSPDSSVDTSVSDKPASSESFAAQQTSIPINESHNVDMDFIAPQGQQVQQRMSRPAPASVKRKRELENNNVALEETGELTEAEEARIQNFLMSKVKPKKVSQGWRRNVSGTLTSNGSSIPLQIDLTYDEPTTKQNSLAAISPQSSSTIVRSPSLETKEKRQRRLPSSSPSSEEERILEAPVSVRPPVPVTQQTTLNRPPNQSYVRQANDHSNSAAPRRISAPYITKPLASISGRDSRGVNAKLMKGG
jgi:hypothetical protein